MKRDAAACKGSSPYACRQARDARDARDANPTPPHTDARLATAETRIKYGVAITEGGMEERACGVSEYARVHGAE